MRLLAGLAFVSVVGFGAAQNFPDTSKTDWMDAAFDEFWHCGLWRAGFSGYFTTPDLLIECIKGMPKALRDRWESTSARYGTPSELGFDRLRRMIEVWEPQIVKLGESPAGLRKTLLEARGIAAVLRREMPSTDRGPKDKIFPDIPENHWAYEAFYVLQKHGLILEEDVPSMFGLFRGPRPLTHSEFAFGLHAAVPRIRPALAARGSELQDLPLVQLRAMCRIFEKNLADIGVERKALENTLGFAMAEQRRLSRPATAFSDVPSGHWASGAVLELQAKGLLAGYPGGHFGGRR